jgi:hypothetical protein
MVACKELSALSSIVDVDDEGRADNFEGKKSTSSLTSDFGLGREIRCTCALIDCETSESVVSTTAAAAVVRALKINLSDLKIKMN